MNTDEMLNVAKRLHEIVIDEQTRLSMLRMAKEDKALVKKLNKLNFYFEQYSKKNPFMKVVSDEEALGGICNILDEFLDLGIVPTLYLHSKQYAHKRGFSF